MNTVLSYLTNVFCHFFVWMYDIYLRIKMPSYYLNLDQFKNIEEYYESLNHSFRDYLFSNIRKFENYKKQQQIVVSDDPLRFLNHELKSFIRKIMQQKNNPAWFYYFYTSMYSMLFKSNCTHVRVIRNQSNVIICFYLDFQTKKMYYCTSALIDHSDSLWKNGSYFFQINEIIQLSFNKCIPLVRLGPTTDELKTKFGGKVKRFKVLPGYNKLSIKD